MSDDLNEPYLDDADKVRRAAKIKENNQVWQQKSAVYKVNQIGVVEEDIVSLLAEGVSVKDLLAKGYSENDLIKLGLLTKRSITTFGSDDVVGGFDTSEAFQGDARKFSKYSGEKMSGLALKKFLEMHPPFGPSNLPNPPQFTQAPIIAKSIKYMNKYAPTKSQAPTPGGPSFSPFAGMYRGPSAAPNSSSSGDADQ